MATRNKSGHTPKSAPERQYYNEFIKNRDFIPTVDESLNFEETTDHAHEFKIEENKRRRPKPIKDQLSEHFKDNWIVYTIGLFAVIFSYFMIDAKIDIAKLFVKSDNIENKIDNLSSDIKETNKSLEEKLNKITDKNHEQDMKIKENELRLEYSKPKK